MNKCLLSGIVTTMVGGYLLWQLLMPVEIVAVHSGDTILVKHFPYLKSRQIAWWEANKYMLQTKYGIPHKYRDGGYDIFIMDFGSGYHLDKEADENADLLCFDDMSTSARCIEKHRMLWIGWSRNTGQFYW